MKLLLTALFASFTIIPAAFAGDCQGGKCDKEEGCKKDDAKIVQCDKREKDGDKKEEAKIAQCGKCDKDGDKKEEAKLA